MRDHATFKPTFWTRGTGKLLRGHPEAQIVATYLMTCASASMVGIYHLAVVTVAHETGLAFEAAWKGLRRCIEVGFCEYDEAEDLVFVPNLARHQVGDTLKPGDRRRIGVVRALKPFARHPFHAKFLDLYASAYGIEDDQSDAEKPPRAKAPRKGLTSPYDPDPDLVPDPVPVPEGSGEGSGGGVSGVVRALAPIAPATVSPTDPIPGWFRDASASVELTTGETLPVGECWLRYAGHRSGKVDKRPGRDDAVYWLTTVVVAEQRRDRQRGGVSPREPERPPLKPFPSAGGGAR